MLQAPEEIVAGFRELQRRIQRQIIASREQTGLHEVHRQSQADTIYQLDLQVEHIIVDWCDEWSKRTPFVVVAEGIEPESGRVFPAGRSEADAPIRLLLDPIDGTRGLMYDKRSGWTLAAAAPNKGPQTRLRDIEIAVMTELPTSKMGFADVLWAIRGRGASAERISLDRDAASPLPLQPSSADTLAHGFSAVSSFFPGTKLLAAELVEFLVTELGLRGSDKGPQVFEDQYLASGGQLYELAVGHDRFIADLRPLFFQIQREKPGLCVHPYDVAASLIAEEAGAVLTDGQGRPLDGPFDVHTPISWLGYANAELRRAIEPLVQRFLRDRGIPSA